MVNTSISYKIVQVFNEMQNNNFSLFHFLSSSLFFPGYRLPSQLTLVLSFRLPTMVDGIRSHATDDALKKLDSTVQAQ